MHEHLNWQARELNGLEHESHEWSWHRPEDWRPIAAKGSMSVCIQQTHMLRTLGHWVSTCSRTHNLLQVHLVFGASLFAIRRPFLPTQELFQWRTLMHDSHTNVHQSHIHNWHQMSLKDLRSWPSAVQLLFRDQRPASSSMTKRPGGCFWAKGKFSYKIRETSSVLCY